MNKYLRLQYPRGEASPLPVSRNERLLLSPSAPIVSLDIALVLRLLLPDELCVEARESGLDEYPPAFRGDKNIEGFAGGGEVGDG